MILNGELISAPRIMAPIRVGRAILAGDFTEEEARRVAEELRLVEDQTPVNKSGENMPEDQPKIMLIVRGLRSNLSREEMDRRYKERMPRFREVEGLVQKYYSYDDSTGEWAGIYFWASEETLAAYLESDLRKSIQTAYELIEPPRIERYQLVDVLRQ